jgi:hypothetical protein
MYIDTQKITEDFKETLGENNFYALEEAYLVTNFCVGKSFEDIFKKAMFLVFEKITEQTKKYPDNRMDRGMILSLLDKPKSIINRKLLEIIKQELDAYDFKKDKTTTE